MPMYTDADSVSLHLGNLIPSHRGCFDMREGIGRAQVWNHALASFSEKPKLLHSKECRVVQPYKFQCCELSAHVFPHPSDEFQCCCCRGVFCGKQVCGRDTPNIELGGRGAEGGEGREARLQSLRLS